MYVDLSAIYNNLRFMHSTGFFALQLALITSLPFLPTAAQPPPTLFGSPSPHHFHSLLFAKGFLTPLEPQSWPYHFQTPLSLFSGSQYSFGSNPSNPLLEVQVIICNFNALYCMVMSDPKGFGFLKDRSYGL